MILYLNYKNNVYKIENVNESTGRFSKPPKNFTTYFVNSPYLYIYVFYIIYKSKVGWFRCFCPSQSTDKPRYLRYFYEEGKINVPCISKLTSIRNWVTFCGPILFSYYEESLIPSNLNSKLFGFHCVWANVGTTYLYFIYQVVFNTLTKLYLCLKHSFLHYWFIYFRSKRDWTWMFHRSSWCQDSNSHYNQSARRCWLESSDRVCHGKVSSLFFDREPWLTRSNKWLWLSNLNAYLVGILLLPFTQKYLYQ